MFWHKNLPHMLDLLHPLYQHQINMVKVLPTTPIHMHPSEAITPHRHSQNKQILYKRIKRMSKWIACMLQLPLFYATAPFQLCWLSPLAKYGLSNDNDETIGGHIHSGLDAFAVNLTSALAGAFAVSTCGCCLFGCLGAFAPADV